MLRRICGSVAMASSSASWILTASSNIHTIYIHTHIYIYNYLHVVFFYGAAATCSELCIGILRAALRHPDGGLEESGRHP